MGLLSKYNKLAHHLQNLTVTAWHATFKDIETVLGFSLPPSARKYPAWWANSADHMPQHMSWLASGWQTRDLNLTAEHVLFVRDHSRPAPSTPRELQANAIISPTRFHEWDMTRARTCRLGFEWVPVGIIELEGRSKLSFPAADAVPAVYCFRIRHDRGEKRYIGQTENLSRRFGHYRTPGPSQMTNIRIHAELVACLSAGGEASVSVIAAGAWIDWGAGQITADLSWLPVRCLLENAALLENGATDIQSLNRNSHEPE